MDWLSGDIMLFDGSLHSLQLWLLVIDCLMVSWSTFVWLFVVLSLVLQV